MSEKYISRLREQYEKEIKPALQKELGVGAMAVPKIEKIVVNMGVGEAIANKKILEDAVKELTAIVGQKPLVNKAKKIDSHIQAQGRNADRNISNSA